MEDQDKWHNLRHDNNAACWPRSHSIRKYDRFVSYGDMAAAVRRPNNNNKSSIWTQLWRKLKRENKKSVLRCSNSTRFTYDEHSYLQNFDPGFVCSDPDDLSRSFSARFAVPSRIFDKPILMV
ncbi:iroquois-class homeodomain protein IRX-4 [Striga asiatica]|uniref:Iroquois-class homeodomain protein IRX-4 n=1 Tax=Striga asiatica TaxID=4170 RepID=A0A5A7QVB7_STRAF|nr:iroquois-class homeodomain protein IRX-4 [Striga asiatica]